jgi:Uma2 family endonuclease
MSARIEPLMTVDDLEAMPEDGNRYEVIEGELFVSCAPGLSHQIVSGNISHILRTYLDEHPIGTIVATPGLILDRYSGVIPDLVFFSRERGAEIIANERLNAAPELVIEILSRGSQNIARDRVAKLQLYSKHKVNEYWIVDTQSQLIEVYTPKDQSLELKTILRHEDEITSALLPGFSGVVSAVFKDSVLPGLADPTA